MDASIVQRVNTGFQSVVHLADKFISLHGHLTVFFTFGGGGLIIKFVVLFSALALVWCLEHLKQSQKEEEQSSVEQQEKKR